MSDTNNICQAIRPEEIRLDSTGMNHKNEETFLLFRDGGVQAILPGDTPSSGSNVMGMIRIRRDATEQGEAGVGGVTYAQSQVLGGWCSYRCRLLSARRFVKRQGNALLQGQGVQDALTHCVRQALADAFAQADGAASCRQIWQKGKQLTAERLLDCGWHLERFTLQRLMKEERKQWDARN